MADTKISWTNKTWNPTTGCSRVSDGCRHCYAETLSLRFGRSQVPWTMQNAHINVRLHPDRLRAPYQWKDRQRVFVNSMSDLFHELIPDDFIGQVFAIMNDLPQHTFQVLTKRSERARLWPGPWSSNIWMGTSVENDKALNRVKDIHACGATVKFLSCEPLLGPLDNLSVEGLDWIIAGGESGPHMSKTPHRAMRQEWARSIRDKCVTAGVAFFYKQDSGYKTELRPWLVECDGSRWEWHQYPGSLSPPVRIK